MSATASFLNGRIQLYLGDAREVVPRLERRFSVACFDAPYKLTSGGAARGSDKHKVMSGGWMLAWIDGEFAEQAALPAPGRAA